MKQRISTLILVLLNAVCIMAQTTVSGIVNDKREPLAGVNIFILGTIDGCLTDSLGRFSFTTQQSGTVTLRATSIGYEEYTLTADASSMQNLSILMREQATSIDEVVVTASAYSFGKSENFKTMDALDVVMSGNSCGDLVAALQTLPGTQKVGEDGKIYVRGGDSGECQTFINGMHVLVPYSTNVEGQAQRGRFSPFLFKGINFSLGGYSGEYGQALSSVLPMETTDVQPGDKLGVSASMLDWNIGGTKAFEKSSLSFNTAYTDLGLYNSLSPDRCDWSRPYRKLGTEAQYKADISSTTVLKTYAGYDFSSVGQHIDGRSLSLKEHNVYANATLKTTLGRGYSLFAGVANSSVWNDIDDALTAGDRYRNFRNEVHLKAEVRKVFSPALKMSAGAEDYLRNSRLRYDGEGYNLDYQLMGAHVDAQWRMRPKWFLQLSTRAEHMSSSDEWLFMPRATCSFVPSKRFQMSLMYGWYSQVADDEYVARSGGQQRQSVAKHALLSMQYSSPNLLLRIEPYVKRYDRLPWMDNGYVSSNGYGDSRGVDVFVENHSLVKNLTTTLSYSFNDSERLYLDYTSLRMPTFSSRHNLRLTAKYAIGKAIVGVAESYASGRTYANGTTPHYNSVDMNISYLVSPKVIVYTSLSNIFGRKNIHGYRTDGSAITSSRDRFFYIAIFVSLKSNKAYDISNF
ncbi:MAG: TonB-dependent receptor [Prevotella sp.]|nr:TonB-dependent receptor [Prevotella sp.]